MARQSTFTNTNPIIESVRALVFKKNFRKDLRKYFNFVINLYGQYGLFQKGIEGFSDFQSHSVPKTGGPDGHLNYFSLSDYISHYSKVDVLKFVQLDYLFRIYFAILGLLLFCNMAHYAKVRLASPIRMLMLKILFWFVAPSLPFGKWRIHPVSQ